MSATESDLLGGTSWTSNLPDGRLACSVRSLHELTDFIAFLMSTLSRSEPGSVSGKSSVPFDPGPTGDPDDSEADPEADPEASVSTRPADL